MIEFLHTFNPQPIIFQYGLVTLHWYGIFVVSGILAGFKVVSRLAKKYQLAIDQIYDLGFYMILFGLVGARIFSVFLDLSYYRQHPLEIFAIWQGGLAIHGAIIAGLMVLGFYAYRQALDFWRLADMIAPALALGQAIGRWGNYFNQEIFGTPTNLPWGIPIEFKNRPIEYLSYDYFHPTFLYESILNILNFALLFFLHYRLKNKKPGLIVLLYLINYSLIRLALETVRTDAVPLLLGLRATTISALALAAVAIGMIGWRYRSSLTLKRR
ncbi:MAG: prolipoprotein diacylglyceryl transferase [Candidatus Buchananbacteria bacterium]|nr:prolipoprotein diacylglyceryl transferase [Candidatus Buchananbacteria bacterium]